MLQIWRERALAVPLYLCQALQARRHLFQPCHSGLHLCCEGGLREGLRNAQTRWCELPLQEKRSWEGLVDTARQSTGFLYSNCTKTRLQASSTCRTGHQSAHLPNLSPTSHAHTLVCDTDARNTHTAMAAQVKVPALRLPQQQQLERQASAEAINVNCALDKAREMMQAARRQQDNVRTNNRLATPAERGDEEAALGLLRCAAVGRGPWAHGRPSRPGILTWRVAGRRGQGPIHAGILVGSHRVAAAAAAGEPWLEGGGASEWCGGPQSARCEGSEERGPLSRWEPSRCPLRACLTIPQGRCCSSTPCRVR